MVFYALITNTITLSHFTLSNFKWQISQNSRNIKNHWNFNLDHIILTRRVGRIFTFSCYKIDCQIIKLRSPTFCNLQLNFPDQNVKKVKFKIQTLLQVQVFCRFYILVFSLFDILVSKYCMRAILSRGLYVFYPIFQCG